jgi:hypothetical protein
MCLLKHGGARATKILVIHPTTVRCLASAISSRVSNHRLGHLAGKYKFMKLKIANERLFEPLENTGEKRTQASTAQKTII